MQTQPSRPGFRLLKRLGPALILVLALALIPSLGGYPSSSPAAKALAPPPPPRAFRQEARRILAGLDDEAKAGQVLLVGLGGQARLSANEASALKELGPGGLVLFGFNIGEDLDSVGILIDGLQAVARDSKAGLPFLVAVDHEGGPVFRFKSGLTHLPAAALVGSRGPAYARALGEIGGAELRALGFNLALAPVVELSRKDNAQFLGQRTYGQDAPTVDRAAGAFIQGLESRGVAATAKHFPGNAGVDPHKGLPRLEVDRAELERDYLGRFRAAISQGVGLVLLSHVLVPAIDPAKPVTLSSKAITGLLKGKLGFKGVVLTDDLFMKALAASTGPEDSAVEALQAGADLLMLSQGSSGPRVKAAILQALASGRLSRARLEDAVLRVIELKLRFDMARAFDPQARTEARASLPNLVAADKARLEGMRP